MKVYFSIISMLLCLSLSAQSLDEKKVDLSQFKLCQLTLTDLKNEDTDLKEVEVEEMIVCPDGSFSDDRFENGKGYVSKLFPGIIFQKCIDNDGISKIRLTKEFKGTLPDGIYVDLSDFYAKQVVEQYPSFNIFNIGGCTNYWSLTDSKFYFYVKIDRTPELSNPLDEKDYITKPIQSIDIIANCQKTSKNNISMDEVLFIIDDKIATRKELEKYDPKDLDSVNVLKGSAATLLYGDKGKNGVVVIVTKKYKNKKE